MYNKPVGKKVNAKSIPGYLLFYVNNHVGITKELGGQLPKYLKFCPVI